MLQRKYIDDQEGQPFATQQMAGNICCLQ